MCSFSVSSPKGNTTLTSNTTDCFCLFLNLCFCVWLFHLTVCEIIYVVYELWLTQSCSLPFHYVTTSLFTYPYYYWGIYSHNFSEDPQAASEFRILLLLHGVAVSLHLNQVNWTVWSLPTWYIKNAFNIVCLLFSYYDWNWGSFPVEETFLFTFKCLLMSCAH